MLGKIDVMKELLGMKVLDDDKDTILEFYIDTAKNTIKSYLNYDDEDMNNLETQIINLAIYLYKNKDSMGIEQQKQGERSITMKAGIPDTIIQSLPMPRIKIIG